MENHCTNNRNSYTAEVPISSSFVTSISNVSWNIIDRAVLDRLFHLEKKQVSHLSEMSTTHAYNPHDISFPEALILARQLGETRIPQDIKIIGISLDENPLVFQDTLSPQVAASIPNAVDLVFSILRQNKNNQSGDMSL